MSSSGCQGLQSCLEPRLVEPRVLRHKLAPPKSSFSPSFPRSQRPCILQQEELQENSHGGEEEEENKNSNSNANGCSDLGAWSFIQALSNTSHNSKEVTENEVYVHPLVKRSSSALSTKSLEMCTESLGCETGSEISESNDELPFLSPKFHATQRSKSPEFSKKLNQSCSFPPPLSSINGSDGVQMMMKQQMITIMAIIRGMLGVKLGSEKFKGQEGARKVREGTKRCQIGSHFGWRFLKTSL
ncbi:hypothetical protein F0562_002559 [Nyssa sinensis]|uniref:Uncharacterized protein n=1 Tax=Nyssa sinensis TaxID=561372 RepID=A0A5J5C641_9ASTE|nr:hypothetical protein F0562_002559 [Nyssa sinensis]